MSAIAGRPTAPSAYTLDSHRVATGDVLAIEYAHHTEQLQVVGEPITVGRCLVNVRVRELDGRHAGNEFGAYLYTR